MSTTFVYAARRNFFRRLNELARSGGRWEGIQVAYCWPGKELAQPEIVYGSQGRFEHTGDNDLIDGSERLVDEDLYFWVHVQVTMSPAPPELAEASDARVEQILNLIGYTLATEPHLCGGRSEATIRDGQVDYMEIEGGIVSHCAVQIGLRAFVDLRQLGS